MLFRSSLPAVGRETDSYKPYIQINQFLTEFLIPLNNPVILDLRSDMEHYAWIPYLSVSDMAYPYTLTEGYACSFLLHVLSLARQKQDRALSDCLQPVSYTHLDVYKRQSKDRLFRSSHGGSAH